MSETKPAATRRTGALALLGAMAGGAAVAQTAPQPAAPAAGAAEAPAAFTAGQRAEIVGVLREALARDPSILRDAIAAMRADDEAGLARARRQAVRDNAEALFRDAADPVMGNPRGDVTVVEFFDARCGYCKALHPTMKELLRLEPGVRVVAKDLPILGPNSVVAARALMAAQRQGKYEALYDALLRLRAEPTEAAIQAEATRAGLDWPRLRRDMDDPAIPARIDRNLRLAQRLGIEGTPALVIGDALVPGAVELAELRRLVAAARG